MEIKVSEEIKKACPQFAGIAIRATVENTAYSESLWKKIDEFTICYREIPARRVQWMRLCWPAPMPIACPSFT